MPTWLVVVLIVVGLALLGAAPEFTGRALAVVWMTAVFGGAVYGGYVAITGSDPIGLGWGADSSASTSPDAVPDYYDCAPGEERFC
jgi:hypothetical protein